MLQPGFRTEKFGYLVGDSDAFRDDPKLNWEKWENGVKAWISSWSASVISKWTEEWGLPKIDHPLGFWGDFYLVDKTPTIGGFSSEFIGGRPDDWPEYVQIAGFLNIDSDSSVKLDQGIEDFLQKDPKEKPVFLSFGSMALADPKVLIDLALAIVEKTG